MWPEEIWKPNDPCSCHGPCLLPLQCSLVSREPVSQAWLGVGWQVGSNHVGTTCGHVLSPVRQAFIPQTRGTWVPWSPASYMRNQAQRDPRHAMVSSELMEGPALPTPFPV